jgi:hypothetical protein
LQNFNFKFYTLNKTKKNRSRGATAVFKKLSACMKGTKVCFVRGKGENRTSRVRGESFTNKICGELF